MNTNDKFHVDSQGIQHVTLHNGRSITTGNQHWEFYPLSTGKRHPVNYNFNCAICNRRMLRDNRYGPTRDKYIDPFYSTYNNDDEGVTQDPICEECANIIKNHHDESYLDIKEPDSDY